MFERTPQPLAQDAIATLERNLRLLPWWWVLHFTFFGEAIWVIYLIEGRGLTLGQVFLFEAVYWAIIIAAEVPTGIVADRYGRRLSIVLGSALTAGSMLAFGIGDSLAMLLTTYALAGLGAAFRSGADSALVFDTLAALGRGEEFAARIGRLNAYLTASLAVCTVLGSAMVHWLPLWTPIVLSGVVMIPSVFVAWLMADPPMRQARVSFLETGRLALRNVRRSRPLWSAIMLLALATTGIVTMGVAMQSVIVDYGVPLWSLGLFVGAQLLLSSVGSLAAAPATRILGLPASLLLMTVAGSLALLAGASHIPWLFPLFVLPSITFNVLNVQIIDFIARRSPEQQRATTISIASVIGSTANVAGTLTVGAFVDAIGLPGTLAIAGLALAAISALAFLVWTRAGDTSSEPGTEPLPA